MEIAGVKEKDLRISIENNLLVIRGHREEQHPAPKQNFHLMELHYGQFERVFRLPGGMDGDQIAASYRQGFLTVRVPRRAHCKTNVAVDVQE